jgi:hypothetical protein
MTEISHPQPSEHRTAVQDRKENPGKPTEAVPSNLWDDNNLPPNMTKELWGAVTTISGTAQYQLTVFNYSQFVRDQLGQIMATCMGIIKHFGNGGT